MAAVRCPRLVGRDAELEVIRALYRREARDPGRTIPRATYLAVVGMAVGYAFIVWSVVQAFGSDRAVAAAGSDLAGMFFTAIATYVGPWAATLMSVLIVSSVFASQLAMPARTAARVLAAGLRRRK